MINLIQVFSNLFSYESGTLEFLILRSILATLTSFLVCLVSGSWFIRNLLKLQVKQYIRNNGPLSHYKKHGTPTMGGILLIFSVFISTIIWADFKNNLIWIVFFSTISFGSIGFIDDFLMQIKKRNKGLSVRQKLLFQIILASIISYSIFLLPNLDKTLTIPFLKKNLILDLGWLHIPFSIFIIVGTANAVNLTDGLDGLAIGNTIIANIVYMLLALIAGYPTIANYLGIKAINIIGSEELTLYCGALAGAGLGFLWFNSYPAQIFMGDTGSLSIGSSLGTTAILIKHEMLLMVIGGVFLVETVSVILQVFFFRITRGRRLLNMAPLHHHFELNGLSEPKIVLRFWLTGIILAIISFLLIKLL